MLVTSAQHNEFEGQDTGCVTATIDGVEMNVPKDLMTMPSAHFRMGADGNTIAEAD